MMKIQPVALLFSMLVMGCGGTSKKEAVESVSDDMEAEVSSVPAKIEEVEVKLKGVYATSTRIPQTQFGYENLFDDNQTTVWSTMEGAGADEGVMLYFEKPQFISKIDIKNAEGNEYSKIKGLKIYVNGQNPITSVANSPVLINRDGVESLFIRLDNLSGERKVEYKDNTTYNTFSSTKPAAMATLSVYSSNNTLLKLKPPTKIKGTISATTTLAPIASYGLQNLFDARKESAWVEGAKGNGIGEELTIRLKEEIELKGLKIANGFQRSDKHYYSNARLKKMEVRNRKNETRIIEVSDAQGEQSLVFNNPLRGSEFTLILKEAFKGKSYQDLAISELKLVSNLGDIILVSDQTEKIKTQVLQEVTNTVLDKYIDQRIKISVSEMDGFDRSIILRSDNTFVFYEYIWDETGKNEELIADGNWETKKLEEGKARIRIFGKLTKISTNYNPYQGDSEESTTTIFQDYLEVLPTGIKGEKFIPEIKRKITNN